MRLTDKIKTTKVKRLSAREALRRLVRYLESDPDLYVGDDDGALGRCMYYANLALTPRKRPNASNERRQEPPERNP
ncbi:MAG TPA: hypothetical protein VM141_12370 [Planctomycetota bacterium]|nr:hypothetical protein [Planctomycetota bacterium]